MLRKLMRLNSGGHDLVTSEFVQGESPVGGVADGGQGCIEQWVSGWGCIEQWGSGRGCIEQWGSGQGCIEQWDSGWGCDMGPSPSFSLVSFGHHTTPL